MLKKRYCEIFAAMTLVEELRDQDAVIHCGLKWICENAEFH